jgi:hypothetical protein
MRSFLAILCLLLSVGAANAQKPHITGNPAADIAADVADIKGGAKPAAAPGISLPFVPLTLDQIAGKIQQAEKQLIDKAIADTQAASLDAQLRNDIISQPCWDAETKFMQLLPVEWVASPGNPTASPPVPASPGPPTEMGPALTLQVGRDLINAVTGSDKSSLKVACAAMIGDSTKIVGQLLGLLGIKAGLAAAGIVIP